MELHVAGRPIFVYTGGKAFDASRPAIVFVHGAAHDHSVWALQSRWFGRHGYAVLAVDLPGHGRSGGEPLASIGELADWIIALLDAAGLQQATLVGHSMGSLACLDAAARHPERVQALALVGCAVPMAVSDALLTAARDTPDQAYRMINQWSHAPTSLLGKHPVPGMWMPGTSLALMQHSHPGALHRDLVNCNDYQGGLEAAANVRCPTLLLLGSRDLMTPLKVGKELARAIAGSRIIVIDGAGHAMMSEAPDAVLDALRGLAG
ncbi:MAG: alpha/beta hydrolase [Rhodocyclaceae bacterium]|nr:alpha/beta hydrolase [Rhodocyclaceae bacterium]